MKVYVIQEAEHHEIMKITGSEIEAMRYCLEHTGSCAVYTEIELEKDIYD